MCHRICHAKHERKIGKPLFTAAGIPTRDWMDARWVLAQCDWSASVLTQNAHLMHPHRIHGAGIYANIWGILMVNVTIYSIHGSYGIWMEKYGTNCAHFLDRDHPRPHLSILTATKCHERWRLHGHGWGWANSCVAEPLALLLNQANKFARLPLNLHTRTAGPRFVSTAHVALSVNHGTIGPVR